MVTEIGQDTRRLVTGLATATAALAFAAIMWGFTVDDALIPVRYARHLISGDGYRWNLGGPSTDGVTPLPWPFLLAPFARSDAWSVLVRAKALNLAAWMLGSFFLGRRIVEINAVPWIKVAAIALAVTSLPVAAHSVSGMETGLVIGLATIAATLDGAPRTAAIFAGLAAALRPELAPWAFALAFGLAGGGARGIVSALVGIAPAILCATIRLIVFGRAAPLAVMAKPSDLAHGFTYAVVGCLVSAAPLLCCAPIAIARARGPALTISSAAVVHLLVVALVGGDWMPYARLLAPIVPSLALAFVHAARTSAAPSLILRLALASGFSVYVWIRAAPEGRHIMDDRHALATQATPRLASKTIAALDIGWASAATESNIVDLAGLTDPEIAALPGGHTSKRVDVSMLEERKVETILLCDSTPRIVELRIGYDPLFSRDYRVTGAPITGGTVRYVLATRQQSQSQGATLVVPQ